MYLLLYAHFITEFHKRLEDDLATNTFSMKEQEIAALFAAADFDNKGYITIEDIKWIVKGNDQDHTDEQWEKWFAKADLDQDGKLSLEEFISSGKSEGLILE